MSEAEAIVVGAGYVGSEITFTVVMSCLTAASGGLILGYDIGITGGLMQMESFLQDFFPEILRKMSAPLYLAEIAPARWRGALTSTFHFFLNVGFFMADLVNYGANTIPRWGWRLSLGVGIVPAAVIIVGAALIPDTPNSLVLRGKADEARASLRRIRGPTADVDAELKDIIQAAEEDKDIIQVA